MGSTGIEGRPTLAAWVAEYDAIGRDYARALAERGVALAPENAHADAVRVARDRLRAKGANLRNGGASVVTGALSDACVACTGGSGSRTFTLSTACNRSCYFCFNANQEDFDRTRILKGGWRDELDAFLSSCAVTHVALTGGEPLLHADEAVEFFARCRSAHPGAHLRLYTAGDHLDEVILARLRDAGLRELRLSVKIDVLDEDPSPAIEEAVGRVSMARRFIPDVMVEMPVIPGTEGAMRDLLRRLDEAGAFGINLLEFGYPLTDWGEFERRGFQIANPPFAVSYDYAYAAGLPIAGSELACLELVEYAMDEGLSLGVHYCSLENKHRDQILYQNRLGRPDPRVYELDGEDFFYKAVKVFDGDVPLVAGALDARGAFYAIDEEDGSLSFASRNLADVAGVPAVFALSFNVLHECGGGLVLRELKLEVMEGCGIMVDKNGIE